MKQKNYSACSKTGFCRSQCRMILLVSQSSGSPEWHVVFSSDHFLQDEVIAVSEKVTVKLEDLAKWAQSDFSKWKCGFRAEPVQPMDVGKNGQKEALTRYRQSTLNSGLNFKDILKEKADLGEYPLLSLVGRGLWESVFENRWAWSCHAIADSQGMSEPGAEVWPWDTCVGWVVVVVSSSQAPSRLVWGNTVIPVCMAPSTMAQTLQMCIQIIVPGSPWGSAGWGISSELYTVGRAGWHVFLRPPVTGRDEQRPFTSHVPSSRSS